MGSNRVPLENIFKAYVIARDTLRHAIVEEYPIGSSINFLGTSEPSKVIGYSAGRIKVQRHYGLHQWISWDTSVVAVEALDEDGRDHG